MSINSSRFATPRSQFAWALLLGGWLVGAFEADAAKEKVESFQVAHPVERAYVAAFLAVQETEEMVVLDASLQAGTIKGMQPSVRNNLNTTLVKLSPAGSDATDVVITYSEPSQLVGFFAKPVAAQVRRNMEQRLSEGAPRFRERYPDVPDRLIFPRPGNPPPWVSHSEEVTTTGSLDDLREAMAKAVDKLGNAHNLTSVGGTLNDQFRLFGKDPEAGLFVFARGATQTTPERQGLSKRILFFAANEVVTFRVLGEGQGPTERRRVRITLDLDITATDIRENIINAGTIKKHCLELRDYFLGQQSQTVELGQSQEDVEAILGKAKQVVNLGAKRILVYDNLKITLVNGKVSDVQ